VDNIHNKFDTPFIESDSQRNTVMRKKMKALPLLLSEEQRALVASVIAEVCVFRNWILHECNVRTNHVHVVATGNADPDKMMKDFKAYCTRRLRESHELEQDRPVWTEGGSTKYLWTEQSLGAAIEYVRNQ
jgi:REP element-mobilizing transposase RayT